MIRVSIPTAERCAVGAPASRRFYLHERSFGFLVAAQPGVFDEIATALALSGASRAADQAVEDHDLFGGSDPGSLRLKHGRGDVHEAASAALEQSFRMLVHLVPPKFGATAFLLEADERVVAWCYEDGYFTYATDEDAAKVMYAETGSLRELRSLIRRSPAADSALTMISGNSLFFLDQHFRAGPGTARDYRTQAARLLRRNPVRRSIADAEPVLAALRKNLETWFSPDDVTVEGRSLVEFCLERASFTLDVLLRSQPARALAAARG